MCPPVIEGRHEFLGWGNAAARRLSHCAVWSVLWAGWAVCPAETQCRGVEGMRLERQAGASSPSLPERLTYHPEGNWRGLEPSKSLGKGVAWLDLDFESLLLPN